MTASSTSEPRATIGRHDLAALAAASTEAPLDLVVVGGGITGAGVARHAAQAGLRTLLLEADDFAAGTSSRSTKLIHGGLRYLAMGDIALVREGALERKSLLAMAPHLTEPRWMLVPAANLATYWKLRIGIRLYEWLGAVARDERHRNLTGAALAAVEPALDLRRNPWACQYREYLTDDARLVLGTLRAAVAYGAIVVNHAPVLSITRSGGGCVVTAAERRSGAHHAFRTRAVVNAAGPWIERLLEVAAPDRGAAAGTGKHLTLSRGVHVVVEHGRLPVRNMVMMTARDGRPVFAIGRDEVTYLGTTDTPHAQGPERWPAVDGADVDYLLETANAHFPSARLGRTDVRASWAGLRPLVHQPGKAPREMSRRDEIWRDGPLVTVAGGKLTGFRRMAEEAMAAVGAVLDRDVAMPTPLAPLPGGDRADTVALESEIAVRYQLTPAVAGRLLHLYGSETFAVLGVRPQPLAPSVFREEVRWAVEVEGADTLEDVVYRRLRAAWYLPDECADLLEPAASIMAGLLGWDDVRRTAELAQVRARLADEHAFRAAAGVAVGVAGAT